MKKLVTLFVVLFFTVSLTQAQALKDSWSLGFGGSVPNMASTEGELTSLRSFGGYLNLQRNFTEHAGLRLGLDMARITQAPNTGHTSYAYTYFFAGHVDLVYYFVPCESFSPFMTIGIGQNVFTADNPTGVDDISTIALQVGISLGAEANLSDNWKLRGELGSYQVASTGFDGQWGSKGYGLLGANSDSYIKFDIGAQWYFSKGEESKVCQLYDGLQLPDPVDYERLENIVKKYIPREVIKEVVVEKQVAGTTGGGTYIIDGVDASGENSRMLLMGVNFDFNSNKLKPEGYPILFHTAKIMHQNPKLNIEVQGYTDNIGSEKANQVLSQKRAEAVKAYLVARGISADRVKAVGYGETNSIGDNKDAAGRAMNRRIEFKVLD